MATYSAIFRAIADYTSAINEGKKLGKSFDDSRRAADRAGRAGGSFGARVAASTRVAQKAMDQTGQSLTFGVTAPLTLLGVAAGRTFADFERKIVSAGSKTDATSAQLEQMKKVALDTAAATRYSATQTAEGLDILAAAGFNARDAIGTLPAVTKAAQAQNADLGLTAEVTAKAMNAFNIPVEKAAHVADVFTQASNTTALDMQQLKDAFGQVGEVGSRYGQSLEDVVAVTGRLVDLGVPAASAGTAIRQALTSLAAPTDKAQNLINLLGLNLRGANGELKPLPDLVAEVKDKLSESNPEYKKFGVLAKMNESQAKAWGKQQGLTVAQTQRLQNAVKSGSGAMDDYAMRTLFGVEGAKAFALAMSDGKPVTISLSKEAEKLGKVQKGLAQTMGVDGARAFMAAHTSGDKFVATSTDAIKVVAALGRQSDGVADKIAGIFQQTTAQRAENFKGSLEALAITVFDRASPALNQLLEDGTRFVAWLTELARTQPTLTRFGLGFLALAASIGPVLFVGGKLIGTIRTLRAVFGVTSGIVKTAGIWLELYGEQATGAGRKVRGGLLTNLGKVTGFLGGPWGAAIGLGVAAIGGFAIAHAEAKKEIQSFADALEYENGKLAENSRQTLAKQLADKEVLQSAIDAGVGEREYTDALINGGQARADMIAQLEGIVESGKRVVNTGMGGAVTVFSDQAQAASKAAQSLRDQGEALDQGAVHAKQAETASQAAATAQQNLGDAADSSIGPITGTTSATGLAAQSYRELNDELGKSADKFSILADKELAQSRANDAYRTSLNDTTAAVKANRDALQAKVDKGILSAAQADKDARAVRGNSAAAIANRDAIRGQIDKLNDKVQATYDSAAADGDYVGAQNKARKETKKGLEELKRHAEKAGLDTDAVDDLIDKLVKVPKEVHTDINFSTNAGKVLVKLKNSKEAADAKENVGQQGPTQAPGFRTGGQIPGRREGGRIPRRTGTGGPQDDLVMGIDRETGRHIVDVSPEEIVVNARKAAEHRDGLLALNAGAPVEIVPKRAQGGTVSKPNTAASAVKKIALWKNSDVPSRVMEVAGAATSFAQRNAKIAAERYAKETQRTLQRELEAQMNGPIGGKGFADALKFAKAQVGKPYIFGSAGPRGYDCSGFMAAIQNVIEGKSPYRRRYSTPAFSGNKAMGFTRNKRSPFMVGVNPAPGKSGHMAGTLQGQNVESSGGVGVRVGKSARGWNNGLFSWRGGLAGGGLIPGRDGDLPYDSINTSGQRYDKQLRLVAEKLYGATVRARGTESTGNLHIAGERGAELVRTRTGSSIMSSQKTLDYLSRIEAMSQKAPANLAALARTAQTGGGVATATREAGDVTLNMPISYVPERKVPTLVAQQQIVRAGRSLRRVHGQG